MQSVTFSAFRGRAQIADWSAIYCWQPRTNHKRASGRIATRQTKLWRGENFWAPHYRTNGNLGRSEEACFFIQCEHSWLVPFCEPRRMVATKKLSCSHVGTSLKLAGNVSIRAETVRLINEKLFWGFGFWLDSASFSKNLLTKCRFFCEKMSGAQKSEDFCYNGVHCIFLSSLHFWNKNDTQIRDVFNCPNKKARFTLYFSFLCCGITCHFK